MNVKQWSKKTTAYFQQRGYQVTVTKCRSAKGSHQMVRYSFKDGWSCDEPFATSDNDQFAYRMAVRHIIKRYRSQL